MSVAAIDNLIITNIVSIDMEFCSKARSGQLTVVQTKQIIKFVSH